MASTHLVIVSTWVTLAGIGRFDLCSNIAVAVARGVRVDIYTDPDFNAQLRLRSAAAEAAGVSAEQKLERAGARLHYVQRIHSKIVTVDARALCIGSFNWLSAAKGGNYQRHEVSLVYLHWRRQCQNRPAASSNVRFVRGRASRLISPRPAEKCNERAQCRRLVATARKVDIKLIDWR
jgi:hypothetical protein